MADIVPVRPLDDAAALEWLRAQPGGRTNLPASELARRWGWPRYRICRRLQQWKKEGIIKRRGRIISCKAATNARLNSATNQFQDAGFESKIRIPVAKIVAAKKSLIRTHPVAFRARRPIGDALAYTAAVGLAGVAAVFSIRGMVVLFPGAPLTIVAMAVAMEGAKLITAGWLAARWNATARVWRGVLVAMVTGLVLINGVGVFSQLVAAHVGERSAATASIETQDADLLARIEVAAGKVADLDHRIGQIDTAIEVAAKRGRTTTALAAIEGQRKARAALASERNEVAGTLAALKTERASLAAQSHRIETEAALIRYVAELVGADTDSERAIRWLIALMVLCCDPLAIALCAATSARWGFPEHTGFLNL